LEYAPPSANAIGADFRGRLASKMPPFVLPRGGFYMDRERCSRYNALS
jgi:hypothetical protein